MLGGGFVKVSCYQGCRIEKTYPLTLPMALLQRHFCNNWSNAIPYLDA